MCTRLPGSAPDQVNCKFAQLVLVLNCSHGSYVFCAAKQGVQVLCFQEVFTQPYLCPSQDRKWYAAAESIPDGHTTSLMREYAKEILGGAQILMHALRLETCYIVIESGNGSMSGTAYTAALGNDSVKGVGDTPAYSYSLSGLSSASVGVVSGAAMDGNNGGWPILYGTNPLSASTMQLAFDEDQAKDSERRHTTEQVAFIVFE